MRILMLAWEFPPFISGGLGTACHGLTRALVRRKASILFVLPTAGDAGATGSPGSKSSRRMVGRRVKFMPVPSSVRSPYVSAGGAKAMCDPAAKGQAADAEDPLLDEPGLSIVGTGGQGGYEGDLIRRINEYADRCAAATRGEDFDVIHAHDWVTFPAGLAIARRTGRPLVVHVHSTEFDRSGENVNQPVYDVELAGVHGASAVVAVSNLTKTILVERYGVSPEKVRVIHNGIESDGSPSHSTGPAPDADAEAPTDHRPKTVLFLGRITMQKGPEFFVRAAERVLQSIDGVQFVIAGWGDLGPKMIDMVLRMGLGRSVRFTGFLRGKEVEQAYRMADVYVMPSVSEPFGLTALEAIRCGVPVVLSRNSGVAEVLHEGALKCDFWDVEAMADQIVSILEQPELAGSLRRAGAEEIRALTWDRAARRCLRVYHKMIEELDGALAG